MGAITFNGGGGNFNFGFQHFRKRNPKHRPAGRNEANFNTRGREWQFPIKSAMTAASLALTGDTIAQLRDPDKSESNIQNPNPSDIKDIVVAKLKKHDWLRALRMTTYGFLLYGPGSQAWYELLDRAFPEQTLRNLSVKVTLNQIVLGPCVIAVVFAWNSLWQGKLKELPKVSKGCNPYAYLRMEILDSC